MQGKCATMMLPTFETLQDGFVQEENLSVRVEETQNIPLIGRMTKGGPKKAKEKEVCSSHSEEEAMIHVTCFKCCKKVHYARKYTKKGSSYKSSLR